MLDIIWTKKTMHLAVLVLQDLYFALWFYTFIHMPMITAEAQKMISSRLIKIKLVWIITFFLNTCSERLWGTFPCKIDCLLRLNVTCSAHSKQFYYRVKWWLKARRDCRWEPLPVCREYHPINVFTSDSSVASLSALVICLYTA